MQMCSAHVEGKKEEKTERWQAELNSNYNTHSSIQPTFHFSRRVLLPRNKAEMSALSPPKIEERLGAHICRHTWPPLLSADCDFLSTLIATEPPAEVSHPPLDPLWGRRRDWRLRLLLFFLYHFLKGKRRSWLEADKWEAGERRAAN